MEKRKTATACLVRLTAAQPSAGATVTIPKTLAQMVSFLHHSWTMANGCSIRVSTGLTHPCVRDKCGFSGERDPNVRTLTAVAATWHARRWRGRSVANPWPGRRVQELNEQQLVTSGNTMFIRWNTDCGAEREGFTFHISFE